jgi:hypothetical protein
LCQLLEQEPALQPEAAVFRSGHNATMPVRSIQNAVAALVRRLRGSHKRESIPLRHEL